MLCTPAHPTGHQSRHSQNDVTAQIGLPRIPCEIAASRREAPTVTKGIGTMPAAAAFTTPRPNFNEVSS